MLCRLDISNYALIDNVKLDFNKGYSVITGETGAGKSILLKALNLLLGDRADSSVLKQNDKKCILEAEFKIADIIPKSFFENFDIDYEESTILRREFTTSGKSRIFINDTPTTVSTLKEFGNRLVKIHTQHQTLELFNSQFQLSVLDNFSGNGSLYNSYKIKFSQYKNLQSELAVLKLKDLENRKEKDYTEFLINELDEIELSSVNPVELENEYLKIQNWTSINDSLSNAISIFESSSQSPIEAINNLITSLSPIQDINSNFNDLILRLNSSKIELLDLQSEIENSSELEDLDEQRALEVKEKIEAINALSFKHNVNSISELITLKESLEKQLSGFSGVEDEIKKIETQLVSQEKQLLNICNDLDQKRFKNLDKLKSAIEKNLKKLSMTNAEVKIDLTKTSDFNNNGKNNLEFLFKTNLGGDFLPIKKSASGGELSRLMLSILTVLAKSQALPTLIFDEIDTGVSGEVAAKMATLFTELGHSSQLISITHLPQIAGKGQFHYHVSKSDSEDKTRTKVSLMTESERIEELAKMMSGESITESAINNAKELLQHD